MRVDYFEDTDTLQITFNEGVVAETVDLDENTLIERDADGVLVSMTLEHARSRADLESLFYKTHRSPAA